MSSVRIVGKPTVHNAELLRIISNKQRRTIPPLGPEKLLPHELRNPTLSV